MAKKIITLTTDFGLRDSYVAEMKATILAIYPEATIVDVTHEIEKFNTRMAAYVLASVVPYFPKGTIHVVVVDPDVGTERRALLIQTERSFFIGPDNGVLLLAAEKQGITGANEIANPKLMLENVSNTFHGRDVFAPAAAHLAIGVSPAAFGAEVQYAFKPEFAKVAFSKGTLTGEVLYVDGFGNIVTNVSQKDLKRLRAKGTISVTMSKFRIKLKLGKTYAETKPKQGLILVGSHGYVEIAVNHGNAAEKFKAKMGDKIALSSQ